MATYFAVIVMAFETGGPRLAGLAAAAQLVPTAVIVPVITRALEKRPISPMRLAVGGMVLSLLGLALAAAAASSTVVIVLAAIRAIAFGVAKPVHIAALPAQSHRASDTTAGLIVTGWIDAVAVMVGPAAAGIALGIGEPATVFWAAFVIAIAAILIAPATGAMVSREAGPARSRPVLTVPGAKTIMGYKAASSILSGATDVIIVLVAIDLLGIGDDGAGLIAGLFGAGGLIGSVVLVTILGRTRLTRSLGLAATGRGAFIALLGVAPGAFPAIAIAGGSRPIHQVIQRLMVQRITPPDRHLRMFSVHEAFDAGGRALGALLLPEAVAWLGPENAIVVAGLMLPLVFAMLVPVFSRIDHDAQVPEHVIRAIETSEAFCGLPCDVIEYLARSSTVVRHPSEQRLIRQGDAAADRAWLIMEGSVTVWRDGENVATLAKGQLVGEMALILESPRSADCFTNAESLLLEITRPTFTSLVVGGYAGAERINVIVDDRQQANHIA